MTLLAGMRCDDCVLLAADSGVGSSSGVSLVRPNSKLTCRLDVNIAWGFYDSETSGLRFKRWLDVQDLSVIPNWDALRRTLEAPIISINGDARRRSDIGHIPLSSHRTFGVVVAGVVGGTPGLLDIDAEGETEERWDVNAERLVFGGAGKDVAQIIYETLRLEPSWAYNEQSLRKLMDLSIDLGRERAILAKPVQVERFDI